ncbi:flavin reductase family protein [Nocardioides sp. InS609-2]|uniref:flavin reductase family protein n=1 Tax=Nocardioides sp. InS609-2 TaxID=2760705 RepID=UPI0020BF8F9B|nr:flavin reductase family protein [Nocardioides sp. InS609-2]
MTIHSEHPFLDPDPDQARRLRGRLGGQVSLWTAGSGAERVGLTVSSLLVAPSERPLVIGLLDPDSDLATRLTSGDDARCVVQMLEWQHRDLAEQFAGQMPAPGGAFAQAEWVQTDAGPRLADVTTWAEVVVRDTRDVGWSVEVTARIDGLVVGDDNEPLIHRRGRYSH